ncbi:MAG: ATP-dependent RecD-like DNA helicase [Faecalibacterium sp.]
MAQLEENGAPELEQLEGTVEDIIFENTDNGYTVFELSGKGELIVVCGVVGELHTGESVVCRGHYENHATYGRQFHAQECQTDMPRDAEAVYAFLSSRSLPYIGPSTAQKILKKFGAQTLDVIANDPARLAAEIPGISPDKADRIQQEFKRMFGMRELVAYLAQFEIGPRRAMEVFRAFGPGAMQAIASNPYLLCGEPLQLDFRHADSIAQYYHMEGDCSQRLEAALLRTLRHNANNGHTCLPRAQLLETAAGFLHQPAEKLAFALEHCLEVSLLDSRSFAGMEYIYLPDLLSAEEDIAQRLALLSRREKHQVRGLDKQIQILELTQGFAYAPAQREAIRKAMQENCLVLTGGPGTGKTTTVNAILQLLEQQADRVALCAPTGRASKRLSELTGRKASTIHRLLEVDYTGGVVSFIHNARNLLKYDVVVLDEMSMVDVRLFQALLTALPYRCRVIMVGDADQLPSVGPGNILGEVIRSQLVPTVCLNEIFRQAARSLIVENAHNIVTGTPLKKGGREDDFFFLESDGEACQQLVCDLVTTRLPRSYGFDPVRDIQVLCPTKLGPTGTQALNTALQQLLNPPAFNKPQLQSASRVFRVGDKVMQVRNNYEIVWNRIGGEQGVGAYNGDIGIVESIDMRTRSMVVRMDDRRLVYPAENLNELEIAYAITVHKSQGSEFPAVILPVAQVPPRLCYRNLFYTGVTRARRLCIVTGRRDTINRMLSNVRQNLRYSGLAALLCEQLPPQQTEAGADP